MLKPKSEGGINLPDIETRVQTQQVMWVKRLTRSEDKPWATVILFCLKVVGGIETIGVNFDCSHIPNTVPSFYKNCLKIWSRFADNVPNTVEEVLLQPVWHNTKLKLPSGNQYNTNLFQAGIEKVGDLYLDDASFKNHAFFQDFPGLEMKITKFQDIPGFPGRVLTLYLCE